MPVPEELERELLKEFEEELKKHLELVRSCPMPPGSLEPIMTRAAERMARLTQETLAKAASHEADSPPCGLSALRGGEPLQPEGEAKAGGDGVGRDPV